MTYERGVRNEEPFDILFYEHKLVLRGDLTDAPSVVLKFRQVLERVPSFSLLVVEAHDARIGPEGVTKWIEAVEKFLPGCELIYEPCQLGVILRYDDRYKHPKSTFQEHVRPTSASRAAD